ncbi:N-carbamoyl-L-amino acid hydrolase [Candida viswanathii]|uniref:N-carbamoyl-L-amino acid hydrolase n=1 Tax=Candida viswanathii TaxID=5486 RepID=A0A367YN01_9ASCO|nr:N-carbamoyl-L-amino acid hydrolase [Candida viswanathii]
MTALTIQKGRLISTIHETAKWGAKGVWGPESTQTGVCRLALSDLDKSVRDWFVGELKSLGCEIKIDQMGNIFGIYPGKNKGLPTGIGSHLDTQPSGGRYDGILGVLLGLEVLRTMKDNGYVPNFPVAVINWTNEEGARFPQSMVSSGVWAGVIPLENALGLKSIDKTPVTMGEELQRIGYDGDVKASYLENPLAAHFEIHIEQGPILENEQKKIGVVTGVQAFEWNLVTVTGKSSHAGTTPMNTRSDAMLIASRIITMAIETATKLGGLATIGTLELEPRSVNVIPNIVKFSLDVRTVKDEDLSVIMDEIRTKAAEIAGANINSKFAKPLTVQFDNLTTSPAISFNETNIKTVKNAAVELFGEGGIREIVSGAGHDSCYTSVRVPTSMIFIPSKDGVSHTPEEYSSPEEVENGFNVLLNTVLKYDQMRANGEV